MVSKWIDRRVINYLSPDNDRKLKPVHRKSSRSKAISVSLLHRDIWAKQCSFLDPPFDHNQIPYVHEPNVNGIVEGIVQVNPWMLPPGYSVTVEACAHYSYHRSEVDFCHFSFDEVVYRKSVELVPPKCVFETKDCLSDLPEGFENFSNELKVFYHKLGGPLGSVYEKYEQMTPDGIRKPQFFRQKMTIIPPTQMKSFSNTPDEIYVLINVPFKLDISDGPDSKNIHFRRHHDPQANIKSRFFVENKVDSESDFSECELVNYDESYFLQCVKRRDFRKKDLKPPTERERRHLQRKLDKYHAHSYPWLRPKYKRRTNGVDWYIRVFAKKYDECPGMEEHSVKLRINKFTYWPSLKLYKVPAPCIADDYIITEVPGYDGGVITLNARLDKSVYTIGNPIIVDIKIDNRSCRVIKEVQIDLVQSIGIASKEERFNKTTLVRRLLNSDTNNGIFPILPGTCNVLYRSNVDPWPNKLQIKNLFNEQMDPCVEDKQKDLQSLTWLSTISKWFRQMNDYTVSEIPLRHKISWLRFIPSPSTFKKEMFGRDAPKPVIFDECAIDICYTPERIYKQLKEPFDISYNIVVKVFIQEQGQPHIRDLVLPLIFALEEPFKEELVNNEKLANILMDFKPCTLQIDQRPELCKLKNMNYLYAHCQGNSLKCTTRTRDLERFVMHKDTKIFYH